MKARLLKHTFRFKRPAGTSRGVMEERTSYFLILESPEQEGVFGIGECAPLPGLSKETEQDIEMLYHEFVQGGMGKESFIKRLRNVSSLQFAMETALADVSNGGKQIIFPSDFTQGKTDLTINGLIWMGEPDFMKEQIKEKLEAGFKCLKLKIGALDFDTELEILKDIRKEYDRDTLEIRVDANGAFDYETALDKLGKLAALHLHSIEQPIAAGHWSDMGKLCKETPLPIALDEELIGIVDQEKKNYLMEAIQPQYIILKPSLHGGITGCMEWIALADQTKTEWWVTSALESNIGLSAIAQFAAKMNVNMPQGLGTGNLYQENIPSPLVLKGDQLRYDPNLRFDFSVLK